MMGEVTDFSQIEFLENVLQLYKVVLQKGGNGADNFGSEAAGPGNPPGRTQDICHDYPGRHSGRGHGRGCFSHWPCRAMHWRRQRMPRTHAARRAAAGSRSAASGCPPGSHWHWHCGNGSDGLAAAAAARRQASQWARLR
jgi:hypothetical protein